MRPWQWVKNGFVFAPVFFAGHALVAEKVATALVATIAFTLISAAVYVFNDLRDADADRGHSAKCRRPIASGVVTTAEARLFMAFLILAAAAIAALGGLGGGFLLVVAIYLAANIGYSLGLKHVAIVEMFIVAGGYVLRLLAGSAAIDVVPSPWILCVSGLIALFLVVGKRRADLAQASAVPAAQIRPVLAAYNRRYLDLMLGITAAATFLSYVLFCVSEYAIARVGTPYLIGTAVFVAFGLFRYLQLVVVDETPEAPAELVIRDPMIRGAVACWVVVYGVLFYW
jgi:4-hydroxybenzoate polyprenyltransferase